MPVGGAVERYQTALSVFTAYLLLQLFYAISRARVSALVGRRAAPPISGTVALLATLSVWLAWKAPTVQRALPQFDTVSSAVANRASAALSAGRNSVLHGVESAREYLDSRKAALDETLQAALEKRVAHLVDIFAVRAQGAMIDRDMPEFVQRLLQDSVRGIMPDVKQHMFKTTNQILITPVKRLRIGPLFPPTPSSPNGGRGGVDDDLLPPFKPCIPWRQLRAAILYLMWPADRSVWRSARSKRWWAAQCLGIVPVVGQLWWLLLFFAKDKTDEHQLADFIVGFESSKFIATGMWSVVYGAMRQHLCLHVIPPGATVWGWAASALGALNTLGTGAVQAAWIIATVLPRALWAFASEPLPWAPHMLSAAPLFSRGHGAAGWPQLPAVDVGSDGTLHILRPSSPLFNKPAHSCMTWGPTISWLDAVFFLLQLVLVALAFGMLPWSRRRYVHSARARSASSAHSEAHTAAGQHIPPAGAAPAAAVGTSRATPGRPTPSNSSATRSVRFIVPSVPPTPTAGFDAPALESSEPDSPVAGGGGQMGVPRPGPMEGRGCTPHSPDIDAGRGCCCQRSGRPCTLAGCACSYALCVPAVGDAVHSSHASCVRRVSTWGLPFDSLQQNGGDVRPGNRTVSLKERGGYLAATNVYFLWTTGITLLLGAGAIAQYCLSSEAYPQAVWRLQSTLYWVRALFGVLALPYMVFRVPLLMQLLVCAQRTAYDTQGNTVLAGGRSEFMPSKRLQEGGLLVGAQSHCGPSSHAASGPPQSSAAHSSASSTRPAPRTTDATAQSEGVSTTLLAAMRRHTPPLGSAAPPRLPPPPHLALPPPADTSGAEINTPVQEGMAHVRRQVLSASQWLAGLPTSRHDRWHLARSAPPGRPGREDPA